MPTSSTANKCQRLFAADEVLDDLDNSGNEQELNASYPDSELESESSDSDNEDRASSSSRPSVSSDSNDTPRAPRSVPCGRGA